MVVAMVNGVGEWWWLVNGVDDYDRDNNDGEMVMVITW